MIVNMALSITANACSLLSRKYAEHAFWLENVWVYLATCALWKSAGT